MRHILHQNRLLVILFGLGAAFLLAACRPTLTHEASDSDIVSVSGTDAPAATVAQAEQPPLDPTYAALIAAERDPAIPDLPFADNPDPNQCGIPVQWGDSNNTAWLSGEYGGELVQPDVLLYDSHLRLKIAGQAPHGARVEVVLYQQNPTIDYYLIRVAGAEEPTEGWIPAPFLSFDPVEG